MARYLSRSLQFAASVGGIKLSLIFFSDDGLSRVQRFIVGWLQLVMCACTGYIDWYGSTWESYIGFCSCLVRF